jgi:hypothetical protein
MNNVKLKTIEEAFNKALNDVLNNVNFNIQNGSFFFPTYNVDEEKFNQYRKLKVNLNEFGSAFQSILNQKWRTMKFIYSPDESTESVGRFNLIFREKDYFMSIFSEQTLTSYNVTVFIKQNKPKQSSCSLS